MSLDIPTEKQAAEAQAYIVENVYMPAFFEKLAANGISPTNEAEATQLIQLGALLAQAEAAGQIKQAATGGDANPFLTYVTQRLAPTPDIDTLVKQGADTAVQMDDMAKAAALVYGHAVTGGELAKDDDDNDNE